MSKETNVVQHGAEILNRIFGSRRMRREAYRRWLKTNSVPRMLFARISDKRNFNRLNELTFLQDVIQTLKAHKEQEQQPLDIPNHVDVEAEAAMKELMDKAEADFAAAPPTDEGTAL